MADQATSMFAANLKILGQVKTPDDLEIHCEIEGPVEAGNVLIAERGFVRGFVRANRLVVSGGLDGNFIGNEVEVRGTGRINGDVVCRSMSVEKSAVINGKCIMTDAGDLSAVSSNEESDTRNLIKPIFTNRKRRRGKPALFLRPDEEDSEPAEAEDRETSEA